MIQVETIHAFYPTRCRNHRQHQWLSSPTGHEGHFVTRHVLGEARDLFPVLGLVTCIDRPSVFLPSTGWRPPLQGKRTVASSDSEWAGHVTRSQPGKGGKSCGRLRKNPKALVAKAAEDSGWSNFPLAISLPCAALNIRSISSPGTPGSHLPVISILDTKIVLSRVAAPSYGAFGSRHKMTRLQMVSPIRAPMFILCMKTAMPLPICHSRSQFVIPTPQFVIPSEARNLSLNPGHLEKQMKKQILHFVQDGHKCQKVLVFVLKGSGPIPC